MNVSKVSARNKTPRDHAFNHREEQRPTVNSSGIDFAYQQRKVLQPTLNEHRYEVLYFHSGSCNVLTDSELCRLNPGDMLLINGLSLQQSGAEEDYEYVCSRIRFSDEEIGPFLQSSHSLNVLRPFQEFSHFRLPLHGCDREETEAILAKMNEYFKQNDIVSYNRFRLSFIDLIYFIFKKFAHCQPGAKELPSHKEKTVREVISYLEQNYMHDITLESLQSYMHMNKFYLSKLFKEITGTTIFHFLYRHRIHEAKKMFMTNRNLSVTEVCYRVGFKHLSHFSRVFKQEAGMTPEAFKKSCGIHAIFTS